MAEKTVQAPFLHGPDTTQLRMVDTAIALLPAAAGAIWFFGLRALWLLVLSVGGCVVLEWAYCAARKKPHTLRDASAVVTGLILGLLLPGDCPWWAVVAAAGAAMWLAKGLFGGLGRNVFNPAAAGCAALLLIPALWPTPLREQAGHFLMGYTGGSLGEASSLLTLVGACYLAVRRLLPGVSALCYLSAAFLTGVMLPGCDPVAVLAWGGTCFCAVFLLGDPVTTPMTVAGKAVFGAVCGCVCTLAAYYWFGLAGACLGVLVMNALSRVAARLVRKKSRV